LISETFVHDPRFRVIYYLPTDAVTMQQCLGDLAGKTVAYVGDYNNVARSLGEIAAALGMHVRYACPHGFDADDAELERILLLGAASIAQSTRPLDAVTGAHALNFSHPELIAGLIDAFMQGRPLVAPPGSTDSVVVLEVPDAAPEPATG